MPARPQGQSFAEFLGLHQQDETKRPNKHTDRVAWNAHFERGIAKSFGSRTPTPRSPKNKADPTHPVREFQGFEDFNITGLNQQLAVVVRELMEKEGSLIALALDKLVYGSFEAEWEKLDSNKKEELVLEGLYRGACTAPRDDSRCVCPEMTITGLAGSGEYNLISMLKRLIAHDPTASHRVKTLFLFAHPLLNDIDDLGTDFFSGIGYYSKLSRTYYIVETLRGVLEAYYDIPVHLYKPAKLASQHSPKTVLADDQPSVGRIGPAIKRLGVRVDKSQYKKDAAIAPYACYTCRNAKDRNELKHCGKCLLVRYCSTECQKRDWPDHKKICCVTRFDPALLIPTPERHAEFIGCPAPIDGYIRTPSLWRQIESLSMPDSQFQDYHFDNGPNGRTRSIRIIHPPGAQIIFLVARRRAMVSGDPAAVNMMFGIIHLMWCHDLVKLTLEQIRGQFERDYRVKIGETGGVVGIGPTDFKLPTKQEMDEEREFQRQRLAKATFAEDDNDPSGLPTRQEIEEQLAYQDGPLSMSLLQYYLRY
ncbi:hypothetical protein K438DRAFT_1816267 [Mycena galopus ATCC 62051]|nr:hypothetical protein K438DRAFT_1816267 [Mycena galopus ATCC 62051]